MGIGSLMNAHWTFDLAPWRWTAALVLLVATAWLSRRQYRFGGRRPAEGALEAFRFLATTLLAFTLLKPERVRQLPRTDPLQIAILIDRSGSMATRDMVTSEGTLTRAEWIDREARADHPRWARLSAQYRLQFEDFPPPPAEGQSLQDIGTDLYEPLDRIARLAQPPRAVLLLSDGDWNVGLSPAIAATRLRMREVPVFTLTVGADRPLPDVAIEHVRAPAYAHADEWLTIPFTVKSTLSEDATVQVILLEKNGSERARRSLALPAMSQIASAIGFAPTQTGDSFYTLRVDPVSEEALPDNNEQTFRLSVRREIIRVLIIETEPRWEYRYLRNAAIRDPGVDVRTLLLHPHLRPGGGPGYLSAFPPSREALSQYDVIFLGDVGLGPGGLTEEQARWLREVVESQASGLVFLPGPSGRWLSLAAGPLEPLLPVEPNAERPRGHGLPVEGRMQLTALGREHLLTMLAPEPMRNERIWANLPGFYWYAATERAKTGAQVLAVHAQARTAHGRVPLLVAWNVGSGKTLFMGMDSAWRWRRGVEDLYHYRFWSQVFRWMAHQRRMAHVEGLRFFYAPEAPKRGDRLLVQATPLDASGFPLSDATLEARLRAPSGAETRYALRPIEGAWAAYQGQAELREGGEFELEVYCRQTDRTAKTRFLVAAPPVEPIGRPARPEVMQEIATVTGGKSAGAEAFDVMLDALLTLPPPPPAQKVLRLWCHPLWLGMLTVTWAMYWMGRKGLGRI